MKYTGFENAYTKNFITVAALIIGTIIWVVGLLISETVVGCLVAISMGILCGLIAVIDVIRNILRYYKYNLINYISKDYLYSCDVNIISKLINNITNMCSNKDECMDTFLECEYLSTENYICYGDDDIKYFVSSILKGISNRYRYRVQEIGYNRTIAIDLWDLNKKICIYITNLEDKQLISFRPIRKAQMMGLKILNSNRHSTYKVEFYNPILKYEITNVSLVLGLVLLMCSLLWNPYTIIKIGKPLILVIIVWTMLWCLNKKKINSMTKFPKHFIKNVGVKSKYKDSIKDKIFDSIIMQYKLDKYRKYLKDVFDTKGIIYNEEVTFGKTDEDFDNLVRNCLSGINEKYEYHKIYGLDGSRQAGIEFEALGMNIIITLSRLDNGQVIEIS